MKTKLKYLLMCLTFSLVTSTASAKDYDPIIFVHGFVGSTALNWTSMLNRFKDAGYPSNRLYSYTYNTLPGVKNGANILKAKVAEVMAQTGKSKVDIITHSMGGLVTRYYMKKLGGANKVDQLVNIATPHKGTIWAALAPITQATRDMTPGSSLIKSIEGYYPGLNLWSWCDEIVIPNSSANVGNSKSIGCWGHVLSTHSWGVFKKARDFVAP